MFWKLAVSTLLLPAYLGFGAVAAKAAVNTENPSQSVYSAIQEPTYYANRNYNQNDCDDNNSRSSRSGGYYQNSYRPQRSYYRQNSYRQNSYHPRRNSGYHNNSYQPQHHKSGHHQNHGHNQGYGYQNNGYNH
jgi:hypothetical protein